MALNRTKLDAMAKPRTTENIKRSQQRTKNREWMRMSQNIALGIHRHLRMTNTTQKEFAALMGVTPAYIGKLLKGQENLTLETIWKIQELIGISFFTSPFCYHDNQECTPSLVAEDMENYDEK